MTAHTTKVQALRYNTESSFGEVSSTFNNRLPIIGEPTVTLSQEMIDLGQTTQYVNAGELHVRGIQGGTLNFRLAATGLGSTAAGSITANEVTTFLGHVFGASDASSEGTTADGTGDEGAPGVNGGTFAAGSLCRVGSINDGRGNGQGAAVSGLAGGTLTLLTDLDATPNAADVVYAATLAYPNEDTSNVSLTSLRFEVLTANQHYECYGCFPQSISLTGASPGEVPFWDITYTISAWAPVSGTFPTATGVDTHPAVPIAAGSVFENVVGTTTRVTRSIRELNVTFNLDVVALVGPEAPRQHQAVVSATRGMTSMSYDYVIDSEATGTDTHGDIWNTAETSASKYHHLFTMSAADGVALLIYVPAARIAGNRPTQFQRNGRWMKRVSWEATTGGTTTSELTLSAFRIGMC